MKWDTGMIDAVFVELLLEEGSGLTFIDYLPRQSGKPVPIIATASRSGGYQEAQSPHGVNEFLGNHWWLI
jgi:hypothetical protein